jgi:hypothetical protein
MRLHHKVSPDSLYYDSVADAPWPWKGYLLRLAFTAACVASPLCWTLFVVLSHELLYRYGYAATGPDWTGTLLAIAGFGALSFIVLALIALPSPGAIPLKRYRLGYWYGSPFVFLFWYFPPPAIRLFIRTAKLAVRVLKPISLGFKSDFLVVAIVLSGPVSWLSFTYYVYHWPRFSYAALDRFVVYDVALTLPAAFLICRFIEETGLKKKIPFGLHNLLFTLSFCSNPALLVGGIIVEILDRRRYGC